MFVGNGEKGSVSAKWEKKKKEREGKKKKKKGIMVAGSWDVDRNGRKDAMGYPRDREQVPRYSCSQTL